MLKIICPKCGREYLPSEIYLPNNFLGKAKEVYRDESGKVIGFDGIDMDLKETYTCDFCNYTFDVEATIDFQTKLNARHDFDDDYSSTIYEDRISLKEDD